MKYTGSKYLIFEKQKQLKIIIYNLMKNKKIEKINVEEVKKLDKISIYLENRKVWEVFFKKDKKYI